MVMVTIVMFIGNEGDGFDGSGVCNGDDDNDDSDYDGGDDDDDDDNVAADDDEDGNDDDDSYYKLARCRDVHVYKLISENTMEEAMLRCAERKLKLEQDMATITEGKWAYAQISGVISSRHLMLATARCQERIRSITCPFTFAGDTPDVNRDKFLHDVFA